MEPEFDGGFLRDPDGRVAFANGRVFRIATGDYGSWFRKFLSEERGRRLLDSGLFVPTRLVSARDAGLEASSFGEEIIEHERLPLVTYPYEWSFDMLRDAALLTLEVLEKGLAEGLGLKDGTPFNVAIRGGRMVFLDWFSLEEFRDGEPWAGYLQFCREFLYPLMLTAYRRVEFHAWFRGTLRGIEVPDMARLLRGTDWFRRGVLHHVVLHALLDRTSKASTDSARRIYQDAGFTKGLVLENARRLERVVRSLRYRGSGASAWAGYTRLSHYSSEDSGAKHAFVESSFSGDRLGRVVDLGCNTGAYSLPLVSRADLVIGVDGDPACINELYADVRRRGIPNYIPVVNDLLNPSPDLGWGLRERTALSRRLRADRFLALALVHHLCIAGNVPLGSFVAQLREWGSEGIVEWVDKRDPRVQGLLRNRKDVFSEYRWEVFREHLGRAFEIRRTVELGGGARRLCHVVRR